MESWTVYKHTFPNGMEYIGITSGKPEDRWANGRGYSSNEKMFSAIVKYGWINIRHEIIASGLSSEDASRMERNMIHCRDGKTLYNTQYVDMQRREVPFHDQCVCEDTCYSRLCDVATDAQWDAARKKFDAELLSAKFASGKMLLDCCSMKNGTITYFKSEAILPRNGVLVRDFWKWLIDDAVFEETQRSESPVAEFMKSFDA